MEVDEKPAAAAAPTDAAAGTPKEEKMDTDIKAGVPDPPPTDDLAKKEVKAEEAAPETEKKVEKKEEEAKPEAPKKKKVVNEDLLRAFRYFDKTGGHSIPAHAVPMRQGASHCCHGSCV